MLVLHAVSQLLLDLVDGVVLLCPTLCFVQLLTSRFRYCLPVPIVRTGPLLLTARAGTCPGGAARPCPATAPCTALHTATTATGYSRSPARRTRAGHCGHPSTRRSGGPCRITARASCRPPCRTRSLAASLCSASSRCQLHAKLTVWGLAREPVLLDPCSRRRRASCRPRRRLCFACSYPACLIPAFRRDCQPPAHLLGQRPACSLA